MLVHLRYPLSLNNIKPLCLSFIIYNFDKQEFFTINKFIFLEIVAEKANEGRSSVDVALMSTSKTIYTTCTSRTSPCRNSFAVFQLQTAQAPSSRHTDSQHKGMSL